MNPSPIPSGTETMDHCANAQIAALDRSAREKAGLLPLWGRTGQSGLWAFWSRPEFARISTGSAMGRRDWRIFDLVQYARLSHAKYEILLDLALPEA